MDSQMKEFQDSIKKYGIITPVIVRPRKEGYYEIISGHRRIYAAEKLGYGNDAGADVFSSKDVVIQPGDICKLPLGFGL